MKNQSTVIDLIRKKNEEWRNEHPMAMDSPWSCFSLHEIDEQPGFYWVNPSNQTYINTGKYTKAQLYMWLEEKDEFLKKPFTFQELKNHCEVGYLSGSSFALKMNHYPPKYYNIFSKKALKNLVDLDQLNAKYYDPKKKFNKHMIEEIECHIKDLLQDYFKYASLKTLVENNFYFSKIYQDKVFYFLEGLSCVGIGYWHYSNTPAKRENFAYYKDFLMHEVCQEVYSNRRIRKYKDFLIDIRFDEQKKGTFHIYYNNIKFPFSFGNEEIEKIGIESFDLIFEKSKVFVDSKEAQKVLKIFKKDPNKLLLAAISKKLQGYI